MAFVHTSMETLRRISTLPAYLLCLCMLAGLGPLSAAQAQKDPVAFLKHQDREVRTLLKAKTPDEGARKARDEKLGKALSGLLDFDELARRSLRDHWDGLSEAQRKEFAGLLRQLVERSYQKNLESTMDFDVSYQSAKKQGDAWLVGTTARSRTNRRAPEITIDYAMAQEAGDWKVFDVVTDGVSLVNNYRRQFDRVMKKQGFEALIEKMRKRLESEGAI